MPAGRVRESNPTRGSRRARPCERSEQQIHRSRTGTRARRRSELVPEVGLEPTRPFGAPDFESSASTSSATPAQQWSIVTYQGVLVHLDGRDGSRDGADPLRPLGRRRPPGARGELPAAVVFTRSQRRRGTGPHTEPPEATPRRQRLSTATRRWWSTSGDPSPCGSRRRSRRSASFRRRCCRCATGSSWSSRCPSSTGTGP
jgi:hypothetical protein